MREEDEKKRIKERRREERRGRKCKNLLILCPHSGIELLGSISSGPLLVIQKPTANHQPSSSLMFQLENMIIVGVVVVIGCF